MTQDLAKLLEQGRLSQRCAMCGLVEAAGRYCSRCLTPTGAARWFTRSVGRAVTPRQPAVERHRAPKGRRADQGTAA